MSTTNHPHQQKAAPPMRPTTRTIGAALAALAMVIAAAVIGATTGHTPTAGAQTGGAIIPCPGSPWGNGWFNTYGNGKSGSVNCSQQNNHIVVDVYNSQGIRSQAAIDIWYGSQCDGVMFINPTPGYPFKIRLRNAQADTSLTVPGCGAHGVPITTSGAAWNQSHVATVIGRYWQCHMIANRTCNTYEGWWDLRPNGINGGPYWKFGLIGTSAGGAHSQFHTDLQLYLQS